MDVARPSARVTRLGTALQSTLGSRAGDSPVAAGRLALVQAGVVVALVAGAILVVRLTGGSPNPLNHLGYGSILLGAYLYGWRGGLAVGVLNALTLGPLSAILGATDGVESAPAWAARGVFFVGIGAMTGFLFDRCRAITTSWRSAASTIALREREAIRALGRGAEAKDADTGEHVGRVQQLTEELALRSGMDAERAADVGWAALLHDVGKLHVPDRILLKPGPLTKAEWEIMRQHATWGEQILAHGDGFELARRIARWHHENFDGSGYPDRLRQDGIPLEARIVRVTDSFDAMTHRRPYRQARSIDWAMAQLERHAGSQFDPDIVALFIALVAERRAALLDQPD